MEDEADHTASASQPTSRKRKALVISLYGTERQLGCLPCELHTDVRTLVQALARQVSARGRPIELPAP